MVKDELWEARVFAYAELDRAKEKMGDMTVEELDAFSEKIREAVVSIVESRK